MCAWAQWPLPLFTPAQALFPHTPTIPPHFFLPRGSPLTYPTLDAATNAFIPVLLAHYAATLPSGNVPLPLGALAAMAHLSQFTTAHTVFWVGDKAYNCQEEMAARLTR